MSAANHRRGKRARSLVRSSEKDAARRRIPFGGVIVTAGLVKRHRYLRDHGLEHSPSVAAVHIGRRAKPPKWWPGPLVNPSIGAAA